MCTYVTEQVPVVGAGKGPGAWIRVSRATVSYDHPVVASAEHTLNIDFADPSAGPSARVAVELDKASALALVEAIQHALASVPEGL
jgi:hypothetical protein